MSNIISAHILLEQAIHSETAIAKKIDNSTKDEHIIANMKNVAEKCYEPAVAHFGADKLGYESFYRCVALNTAIGGSSTSGHMRGECIDAHGRNGLLNVDLFFWLKDNVEFDQLILEARNKSGDACWVHVSNLLGAPDRRQALIAEEVTVQINGKNKKTMAYHPFSLELFNRLYPNHKRT